MKFLLHLFTFLFIAVSVTVMGFIIAKPHLDRELFKLIRKTEGRSFELNFFDYGKVRPSGLGLAFGPIRARGITRVEHPYFDPRELEVKISRVRFSLKSLTFKSFKTDVQVSGLEVKGGRRLHEDVEDHERLESVAGVDFKTTLQWKGLPHTWKTQMAGRAKEFKDWVFEDQPIHDVELRGSAVFIVDDWPVTVRFHSVKETNAAVHLEGDQEDLRVIAEMIEPKFTDADLQLAAKNLLKAPKLLRFRIAAENQAIRLHGLDPEIFYDVPRHIYWSYYLTKAYGENFTREATNAHEIGDALNSDIESAKDRHHNELGIEYANRHLTEAQVEKLIFTDKRVIRMQKEPEAINAAPATDPPKPAEVSAA